MVHFRRCKFILFSFLKFLFLLYLVFNYSFNSLLNSLISIFLIFFLDSALRTPRFRNSPHGKSISSNHKSAVKMNQFAKRLRCCWRHFNLHSKNFVEFQKFTSVFSKISYKPQTMAESSNRFIALDKTINIVHPGTAEQKESSKNPQKEEARKVLKKANMS